MDDDDDDDVVVLSSFSRVMYAASNAIGMWYPFAMLFLMSIVCFFLGFCTYIYTVVVMMMITLLYDTVYYYMIILFHVMSWMCCSSSPVTVPLNGAIIDHTASVQSAKACAPGDNHGLVMLADTEMMKIGGANVCGCPTSFPNIDGMYESEEECAKALATVVAFAENNGMEVKVSRAASFY